MKQIDELLYGFLAAVREDPRMAATHISLYVALLYLAWERKEHPVAVFSHEVMPFCKINASSTYHRTIRQLAEYRYIRYVPSYNHFLGSLVYLGG